MKYVVNSIIKYPEMEIQDVFKLVYQSEFGCGHLITNEERSYSLLMNEWNKDYGNKEEELFERIGGGYVRLYVEPAKALGVSPQLFQKIFVESVKKDKGTLEGFHLKVQKLIEGCNKKKFPFSESEIQSFLKQWEEDGRPLFRHSEKYRRVYKPSYRVVSEEYINMLSVIMKIQSALQLNDKVVIGIDGPCGAGKTTLAKRLADFYAVQVIHMDDFFLPPVLRSSERLAEPGGNIHYERFCQEVTSKIKLTTDFDYRVFSCRKMDFDGEVKIANKGIIIIEGSYSMHPLFDKIYDVRLYCDVDAEEQKIRIIKRNGLSMYKNFEEKWIPMEAKYFEVFNVKEKSDLIIK